MNKPQPRMELPPKSRSFSRNIKTQRIIIRLRKVWGHASFPFGLLIGLVVVSFFSHRLPFSTPYRRFETHFQQNSASSKACSFSFKSSRQTDEYNLPELLNFDSFLNSDFSQNGSFPMDEKAHQVGCAKPASLLGLYRAIPSVCARQPYRPHLVKALERYATGRNPERLTSVVATDETLTVQINSDTPLLPDFQRAFLLHAARAQVIVVAPTSRNESLNVNTKAAIFKHISKLRSIAAKSAPNAAFIVRDMSSIDKATYLFYVASQLLVHGGPIAALAAFVCDGIVYHTSALAPYINNPAFRWALRDPRDGRYTVQPKYKAAWRAIAPVTPSCCNIERLGIGDGEKYVCTNMEALSSSACWVLSIGCGGLWDFERLVTARWNCTVHVFDCTGDWEVPVDIADQVKLHKLCVGGTGDIRAFYRPLQELIQIGSSQSGLGNETMPVVFKLDAEGAEFPVLNHMLATTSDHLLPQQMIIEFHLQTWHRVEFLYVLERGMRHMSVANALDLFGNLTSRGYTIVHRADNPGDESCSELTLVHRDRLPPDGSTYLPYSQ